MDLGKIGWEDDWIHLVQYKGPVPGSCKHNKEHSGPMKGEFLN
jgi:hypothetical protein